MLNISSIEVSLSGVNLFFRSTKLNRQEKQLCIEDLRSSFSENGVAVIVKQSGLTVKEACVLRKKLLEANASYKVSKNTLAKVAIRGTEFEVLEKDFSGPTAIAFSKDPVSVAKVICDFAKDREDKFEVVGGFYNASRLSEEDVINLSKLPTLDELKSKLIAIIKTPSQNVFSCVRGVPEKLTRVINEFSKK